MNAEEGGCAVLSHVARAAGVDHLQACTAHQPSTIASSEIEARWACAHLCQQHRDELVELCERHLQAPCEVSCIGYDEIDLPLLRFTLYVRGPDDRVEVDEWAEPEIRPKTRKVEKALVGELPHWWRPGSRPLDQTSDARR